MKRCMTMILTLLLTGLLLTACGGTTAEPMAQTAGTTAETTSGDPIVIEKQEDPKTVLEPEADISLLEDTGDETVPSETAGVPSEGPTEGSNGETAAETTMPEKEDDGYFNLVIKP